MFIQRMIIGCSVLFLATLDLGAGATAAPVWEPTPAVKAAPGTVKTGSKLENDKKNSFYRRYFRKGQDASGEDLPTNPEDKAALLKKLLPKHSPTPVEDPQAREIRDLIHDLGADHHRRLSAVERLAMIGQPAVPALRRALRDPYKFKRIGALDALGYIHALDAIPDIQKRLDDREPSVRLAAIKTLGRMRHRPSLDRIAAKLEDSNVRVRREAVLALARMKGTAGRDALLLALKNRRPEIRRTVCEELARFEGKAVVRGLLSATHDPDRDTRLAAVRALGDIGDPSAEKRLRDLARGDDAMLRQEAIQAIKNLE